MGPLDVVVERFTNDLAAVRAALNARPTLRLGTITSVAPLRVHLDGDTAPLPASPRTLAPVGPGDRVTVAHHKRVVTVLGVMGTSGRPWRVAAGTVTMAPSGTPVGWIDVTFPAGRFTLPPIVHATAVNGAYAGWVADPSTGGVTVGSRRVDGGNYEAHDVNWYAIQMTPTSAGG